MGHEIKIVQNLYYLKTVLLTVHQLLNDPFYSTKMSDKTKPRQTRERTDVYSPDCIIPSNSKDNLLYQLQKTSTITTGIPADRRELYSLKWCTLSKAFLMSRDAIETELPSSVKYWSVVLSVSICTAGASFKAKLELVSRKNIITDF